MIEPMRLAWFSPLSPARTGIAAYTTEILPLLAREHTIEAFDEHRAHEFAWRARRTPYDLVVYQLGNAPCHDYQWGYLAAYPGLVVLHDARLHHARARQLLAARRADDYRREFRFDHPGVHPDAAEYAVGAMGGPVQYLWPMRRVALTAARRVAVHNTIVADDLRARVRAALGIGESAIVFAAFGKMTAEKRIGPIVGAFAALVDQGIDAHLLLVGECDALQREVGDVGGRVHATGYVADADIAAHLLASDVCLCLRWPTALETSASWLRCLAAARATIVSDLAHTADVPLSVAPRVDLLDEDRSLAAAMRTLATNPSTRAAYARAGHEWWALHHTMDAMADDYRRTIAKTVETPAQAAGDLPLHFMEDHGERARAIVGRFGVSADVL